MCACTHTNTHTHTCTHIHVHNTLTQTHAQTKAVVYEQEIYNQFTYKEDRPFFHSFPGDVSYSVAFIVLHVTFVTLGCHKCSDLAFSLSIGTGC